MTAEEERALIVEYWRHRAAVSGSATWSVVADAIEAESHHAWAAERAEDAEREADHEERLAWLRRGLGVEP
jgi:hypothetical protein